ncbi:hypothetical protein [Vibrio cyclitrophicus]|uniref:hypothetical protein n=1 Tax=Vibrio cyclitrophicus TaxID=47951 RepID=UPI000C82970E|nr:hypothetical protein BCV43_11095 [Vibrio cyclitrophicus]PMF30315.1 hypothetical protein BCV17_11185 [Vibrio cyclitrophicus]
MKRLILNITLLGFMALGSFNAVAHASTVKYGIAVSHDGEQIAYGKSRSGDTTLLFIHGWSLDSSSTQR